MWRLLYETKAFMQQLPFIFTKPAHAADNPAGACG